jgi:hypothetical protein
MLYRTGIFISGFTVHRFLADLSDHCQISLLLKVNFTHEENNKNLPLMPDKYIWDKESGPEFQTTLASIPPIFVKKLLFLLKLPSETN